MTAIFCIFTAVINATHLSFCENELLKSTASIVLQTYNKKTGPYNRVCMLERWYLYLEGAGPTARDPVPLNRREQKKNRVCITAPRQPNFYLLGCHAAPRYRLQILFPGSRDPRGCRDWWGFIFGSRSFYIPAVKNAWGSLYIRRLGSKNYKINCKLIFGLRLSCFPASAKKKWSAAKYPRLYGPKKKLKVSFFNNKYNLLFLNFNKTCSYKWLNRTGNYLHWGKVHYCLCTCQSTLSFAVRKWENKTQFFQNNLPQRWSTNAQVEMHLPLYRDFPGKNQGSFG